MREILLFLLYYRRKLDRILGCVRIIVRVFKGIRKICWDVKELVRGCCWFVVESYRKIVSIDLLVISYFRLVKENVWVN